MDERTQEDIQFLLYNLAKISLFMLIISGQGIVCHLLGVFHKQLHCDLASTEPQIPFTPDLAESSCARQTGPGKAS
jgi:hypothetical protein